MQQKWDNIDRIILNSKEDIDTSFHYNEKLLNKLYKKEKKFNFSIDSRRNVAASLIIAGVLMMVILNTDLHYYILEARFKIIGEITSLQYRSDDTANEIFDLMGE